MADKGEPASTPSRGFYRKGPLRLRGDQVPEATADQRLLDRGSGAAWAHEDPWRVMRIQAEFVEGFGTLAEVGPAVRSEEHTSELQSRGQLVCRLLLEKKKRA